MLFRSILLDSQANTSTRIVEALYSIKVNLPTNVNRTDLWIDVFRFNSYTYDYDWSVTWTPGTVAIGVGHLSATGQ